MAIVQFDPHGNIIDANAAFLNLVGYSIEELRGRNHQLLVHPDEVADASYPAFWAALRRGEPQVRRCRRISKSGEEIFLQASYSPLTDRDGKTIGVLKLANDVTASFRARQALQAAQRQTQAALHETYEQLNAFFDLSLDSLCMTDAQGRFLRVNRAFANTLGYDAEALVGGSFLDLVHPEDQARTLDSMHGLAAGRSSWNFVNRYLRKDGEPRWLEWRAHQAGPVIYGAARDVTERLAAEAQLRAAHAAIETANRELLAERQSLEDKIRERTSDLHAAMLEAQSANQAKSQFIATVSHELRTPLNAIIGYAEILREDALQAARNSEVADLNRVLSASNQLLQLINDILDLSKAEVGRLIATPGETDLQALIRSALDSVRPQAAAKRIALKVDLESLPARAWVDERKLRQALLNLLSNAVKFTERGHVAMTAAACNGVLEFTVADTGIGIEPDLVPRLFQPFVQGEAGITRRFGGTGLGLAITKRLAELMGGDVCVHSRPGEGAEFRLTIPLEQSAQAA